MATIITAKVQARVLERIFTTGGENFSIKYYQALDMDESKYDPTTEYTYEIEIRHADLINVQESFDKAVAHNVAIFNTKDADAYIKREVDQVNESSLTIHWWNHGKKSKHFDGNVKDYLKANGITIKAFRRKGVTNEYSRDFKVSFTFGSLVGMKFTVSNYFDAAQKSIFFQMAHLGDKSKFSISNREYSVNYHR